MTPPSEAPPPPGPRHRLSPKKLLLSKWTAVAPLAKEKHFVVTQVFEPEPPGVSVEQVELQAVHSGRSMTVNWRELTDASRWHQGWR